MKITSQNIKVSELVAGYEDKAEEGVRGYQGRLNIRPAFQREFIYKEKQRNEVINTVRKNFPLNTMYWAVAGDDFELMDGQQRTVSICQYVSGDFPVVIDGNPMFFNNLTGEKQKQILDYELFVYVCEGTEGEKLDWFKIINIAGEKLTDQELRNAIYTGPWLADAKRWFSKTGAPASAIGSKLVDGIPIRQQYLETAIEWLSDGAIEKYMAEHQHDPNANELWTYFQNVINWVNLTFPNYRKEMKGVSWGPLYNKFRAEKLDTKKLEEKIVQLMQDEDVTKKSGIYDYVLTGSERALSIRAFSDNMKREAYERQKGVCPTCNKHYDIGGMEADHITPWSKGGKTTSANCRMLCKADNRTKSGK
jgi:hypothetical protein